MRPGLVQHGGGAAAPVCGTIQPWAQGILEGLSLAGLEFLLLGPDGKAFARSIGLRRLLGTDLKLAGGVLTCDDPDDQNSLARALRNARNPAGHRQPATCVVLRRNGRKPLLVEASRMHPPEQAGEFAPHLLLVFHDLNSDSTVRAQDLRDLFRLSMAEAEVAVLIAQGMSVADVANLRGVARETVRGQLKSLFRKLDIRRQSELVRLVDRLGRCATRP